MSEHQEARPDDATSDERPQRAWSRHLRHAWLVRPVLLVAALLGIWAVLVAWWVDAEQVDEPLFDAARIVVTFVVVALSALWGASIRYTRLRYALRPIEAGAVVGALALAAELVVGYGSEVDTIDDATTIAVVVGFIAALVVACVERLTDDDRSARRWGAAVMAAAVVIGGVLPAVADRITGSENGWAGLADPAMSSGSSLLSRMETGGGFRIDPFDGFAPTAIDPTTGSEVAVATPGPTDGFATTDPAASGAPVPTLGDGIAGFKAVVRDGAVDLELPALVLAAGTLRAEVRSGSCGFVERAGAKPLDAWRIADATTPSTRRGSFSLGDLPASGAHLLVGTGGTLDVVACQDLADPRAVALARAGAASFAHDCLAHARLSDTQVRAIGPESFQDPSCARRLTELEELASRSIAPVARVEQAVECLAGVGIRASSSRLGGGYAALDVPDPIDGHRIEGAYACGYDGSGVLSEEGVVVAGASPPDGVVEGEPVGGAVAVPADCAGVSPEALASTTDPGDLEPACAAAMDTAY